MTPTSRSTYLIPTREAILGLLRKTATAIGGDKLAQALAVEAEALDGFSKRLAAMQRDGQLELDARGNFKLGDSAAFVTGRAQGHRDGFGFVLPEDGTPDIFLSEREMQKVMHSDRVQVRLVGYDRRGRPEGQIVEVLERANTIIIGRLVDEKGVLVVAPEDKRLSHDILLAPGGLGKAKVGQVVSVQITHFPDRYTQAVGKIVEVLGEIDDPGMEIEIAVRKFNVPYQFSKACAKEAAALSEAVSDLDREGRVDLRDIPLVTIDGADARDFDDAVYCEPFIYEEPSATSRKKRSQVNGWRLLVGIADVSHYVRPGHALDVDALERATSVYFPRRVIPMLPEKLSNGLCSLNPQVDRLCMVCDMVVGAKGEIVAYQFYPAVMHSAARLTYDEVWSALSNTRGPEAHKRAALMPHLQNLYDLYQVLLKAREQRGAIDFDTTETQIVCNAHGKIEQILPRVRNDAHKLIEECMLAANVCAADLLVRHHQPALYRVHGGPTPEKLESLRAFLRSLGLTLTGGTQPQGSDYARLLDAIKGRPDASLVQTMVLRSFQQAVYAPENIGHFGLAYPAYAHFTSPIRRYPDLLIHRAIKSVISSKKYHPSLPEQVVLNTALSPRARKLQAERMREEEKTGTHGKNTEPARIPLENAIWAQLGIHCSANERRADEASRDVEAWLKCYFMRDKLGEEYTGTVTAVTSFGLFVQLDTLYIEGLVHVTELGSDYFEYDEVRNELRGQRTGIRYRLTERIHVQVSRVDLDARRIDFRMVAPTSVRLKRKEAGKENGKVKERGKGRGSRESILEATESSAKNAARQSAKLSQPSSLPKVAKRAMLSEEIVAKKTASKKAAKTKSGGKGSGKGSSKGGGKSGAKSGSKKADKSDGKSIGNSTISNGIGKSARKSDDAKKTTKLLTKNEKPRKRKKADGE